MRVSKYFRGAGNYRALFLTFFIFVFLEQCVADATDLRSNGIEKPHARVTRNAASSDNDTELRLTEQVKPQSYDIYLHPYLNNATYDGRVSISFDVLSQQKLIKLNQKNLAISSVSLRRHDGNYTADIEIEESRADHENEVFIVKSKENVSAGAYSLSLSFSGSMKNKINGFYSSKYKDEFNKTRTIATTQFESTYARHAFPCFDEPNFKAEFSVKLVHPNEDNYSALSNMNVESTAVDEPAAGFTTVTFAKSVPMSTYLVCFIVSDFVSVTKEAKGLEGKTFPISAYTTKEQKEKVTFAVDTGVKLIEYYVKLFDVNYPLPKLDMAAIPDFNSGAMENWGLVTYRETAILYDKRTSSVVNKRNIVSTIAHEFAHMWFGNLVTMKWWNDLWLNEGFATLIEYKGPNDIFPEWKFIDQFLLYETNPALALDAKINSHPIVQEVNTPDQIEAMFDLISYQKGASILRMLENSVGSDVFFAGVSNYLKKFSYKNAVTEDLFDSIQNVTNDGININAIMDTWTRQMGYPVVSVRRDGSKYVLRQKRFLDNKESSFNQSKSPFDYKWVIPITYVTSQNSTPTLIWFDKDAPELIVEVSQPAEWIKFNDGQIGFYRVNYAQPEWMALIKTLHQRHTQLSTYNRVHLLEDAFSLANAGELNYIVPLTMTLYMSKENNHAPWQVAAGKFKTIGALLSTTESFSTLRLYVRKLVDKLYYNVTWNVKDSDSMEQVRLRSTILDLACYVGHAKCLEQAGVIFKSWIHDKDDVRPHPDIRTIVYYYGMNSAGGEAEWNTMFKRFTDEKDAAEKVKLRTGLSGIRSKEILKKFITLAMDENYVRSQDALDCLVSISYNPIGNQLVWDWVRKNWQTLVKRYTLSDNYLGELIPDTTSLFTSDARLSEMRSFFERYPKAGAGESSRKIALETVEGNIKWLKSYRAQIDSWLNSHTSLADKVNDVITAAVESFFGRLFNERF